MQALLGFGGKKWQCFCIQHILIFSSFWTKSRKSYCTTPGVGVGVGIGVGGGVGISKMLKFYVKIFLCDGQGAVRPAILSL